MTRHVKIFITMLLGLALMAAIMAVLATKAHAQAAYCATHDKLTAILGDKYSEHVIGMGTAGDIVMVELFVSDKGTFTIVSTGTDSLSCIAGAGDNWQTLHPPKADEGNGG